jgi:hypothetical protein
VQPAASVELQRPSRREVLRFKNQASICLASVTPYKERAFMGDMKSVEVKIQHSYKRMKWKEG